MAQFAGAPSSYFGAEAKERQRRSGYALLYAVDSEFERKVNNSFLKYI